VAQAGVVERARVVVMPSMRDSFAWFDAVLHRSYPTAFIDAASS
jgi:disulfide oxidoreductase YuzD